MTKGLVLVCLFFGTFTHAQPITRDQMGLLHKASLQAICKINCESGSSLGCTKCEQETLAKYFSDAQMDASLEKLIQVQKKVDHAENFEECELQCKHRSGLDCVNHCMTKAETCQEPVKTTKKHLYLSTVYLVPVGYDCTQSGNVKCDQFPAIAVTSSRSTKSAATLDFKAMADFSMHQSVLQKAYEVQPSTGAGFAIGTQSPSPQNPYPPGVYEALQQGGFSNNLFRLPMPVDQNVQVVRLDLSAGTTLTQGKVRLGAGAGASLQLSRTEITSPDADEVLRRLENLNGFAKSQCILNTQGWYSAAAFSAKVRPVAFLNFNYRPCKNLPLSITGQIDTNFSQSRAGAGIELDISRRKAKK